MAPRSSRPAGKYRRRALLGTVVGSLAVLALIGGSDPALATTGPFVPAETASKSLQAYCTIVDWGGTIFCKTSVGYNFPDGEQQVFGIAPNFEVYTNWGNPHGSQHGWVSMGSVRCDPGYRLSIPVNNGWSLELRCMGEDSSGQDFAYEFNFRGIYPSSTFTGWTTVE